MQNYNSNNYYLLDKFKAERFFEENCFNIFKKNFSIKILSIKRSNTYNPDNYNILYVIKLGEDERKIRISTSKISSKKDDYLMMSHFFNKRLDLSFNVPKPLVYLDNKNIFIYEDLPGQRLSSALADLKDLPLICNNVAIMLRNIHKFMKPDSGYKKNDFIFQNYNIDLIEDNFPSLKGQLFDKVAKIQDRVMMEPLEFCHGDYNPNNLIIEQKNIGLIDFGSACYLKKELDLASFLVHLRIMLRQKNILNNYPSLKDNFLQTYGSFNQEIFESLSFIINLRLLEISLVYPWADNNEKTTDFIYKMLEDNIVKK